MVGRGSEACMLDQGHSPSLLQTPPHAHQPELHSLCEPDRAGRPPGSRIKPLDSWCLQLRILPHSVKSLSQGQKSLLAASESDGLETSEEIVYERVPASPLPLSWGSHFPPEAGLSCLQNRVSSKMEGGTISRHLPQGKL